MSNRRVTPEIRCIDCGNINAYERKNEGVWDIHCPDCGATFGWDNIPTACRGCGGKLRDWEHIARGTCSRCFLDQMDPRKKAALNKLIGMAFRKTPASDAEKDAAVDETFKAIDGTDA